MQRSGRSWRRGLRAEPGAGGTLAVTPRALEPRGSQRLLRPPQVAPSFRLRRPGPFGRLSLGKTLMECVLEGVFSGAFSAAAPRSALSAVRSVSGR